MTPPIFQKGGVAAPTTRAELDALVMQRSELQAQLRAAEERRTSLTAQSQVVPPGERGTLSGRIATLDGRIQRLESQIDRLDEAIAEGTSNPAVVGEGSGPVIAVPPVPPVPPTPEFPHFPDGPGSWTMVPPDGPPVLHPRHIVGGAMVTLSMMALVAWVTWRRAVARFGRRGPGIGEGAEVARLQQSVDAIAIEVERISEGQRFLTKVLHERGPVAELAGQAEPQQASSRREL